MALATTTLSSAVSVDDNVIVVASATSVAAGRLVRIDDEWMQVVQSYVSGTTVGVLRGQQGSATLAHVVTANVTHGLASDFSVPPAGVSDSVTVSSQRARRMQSITATSTLVLPKSGEDLVVILNGTTIITLTIPVPTKDLDGTLLWIASNGAAAHVPTFTSGLGGAGASYDAITINATAPVLLGPFMAVNGFWQVACGPAMGGTVTNLIGSIA